MIVFDVSNTEFHHVNCTSRNFLLSTDAETSTGQCKILSGNLCTNPFIYQNLFHLKYFINVNLKYFLGTPKFSGTNGPVV